MSKNLKIIVVSVAVILLGVGLYYYQIPPKPTSYLDSSLVSTYTILGNESEWRAKYITTDNPEAWSIPEKNIRVEIKNSQNNFYCGSKHATYKNYSSYSNPKYNGAWNSV